MKNRTCKWPAVCPMKYIHEKGRLEKRWLEDYCHGDWASCVRYQKEEKGIYHPDNMLPDGTVDETLKY